MQRGGKEFSSGAHQGTAGGPRPTRYTEPPTLPSATPEEPEFDPSGRRGAERRKRGFSSPRSSSQCKRLGSATPKAREGPVLFKRKGISPLISVYEGRRGTELLDQLPVPAPGLRGAQGEGGPGPVPEMQRPLIRLALPTGGVPSPLPLRLAVVAAGALNESRPAGALPGDCAVAATEFQGGTRCASGGAVVGGRSA